MVSAIAAVTTSHQKPNPRSLPTVAMNRDLINRTGELIRPRTQPPARRSKDLIKRAEDLAWARTRRAAPETLSPSRRHGMNNQEPV